MKFSNVQSVLNLTSLVLAVLSTSLVGYSIGYSSDRYRSATYSVEIVTLMTFGALSIEMTISILTQFFSIKPFLNHTQCLLSACIYSLLAIITSIALLIRLCIYGRFLVKQFEIKIFVGVMGMTMGLLQGCRGYWILKERRR